MTIDDDADLPYGENFHDEAEAAAWADAAARKRPWRTTIFDHFVTAVTRSTAQAPRILELGSGPGLLAEQVLDRCPANRALHAARCVVCDHLPDGALTPQHRRLYMTIPEYLAVLANAGFADPTLMWSEHEMALYHARA